MKISAPIAGAALLATLVVTVCVDGRPASRATGFRDGRAVARGMSAHQVVAGMHGLPDDELAGAWLYWGPVADEAASALVICFERERVARIRMVDARQAQGFLRLRPAGTALAADDAQ